MLAEKGFQVHTFSDVDEVEENGNFRVGDFALFIMDYELGESKLLADVKKIRNKAGKSKIPIMVISPESRSEIIIRLMKQGIDDYFLKPIEMNSFISRVFRLLDLYQTGSDQLCPQSIKLDMEQLLNFEVLRALRGQYSFSIIRILLTEIDALPLVEANPQYINTVEVLNRCYQVIQKILRKTDLVIGRDYSLLVLCLFTEEVGISSVLEKMYENLRPLQMEYRHCYFEVGHATFPNEGNEAESLWCHAAINKKPLYLQE